jgi:hypothetical protein
MTISSSSRLEQLGRFLLRGLRIGASTVSIIELLRNDWTGGVSAGIAWLVFLQVERRFPSSPADPPSPELSRRRCDREGAVYLCHWGWLPIRGVERYGPDSDC